MVYKIVILINAMLILDCIILRFNPVDAVVSTNKQEGKRNLLLIISDDLRAEIGAFIDSAKRPWLNPDIQTPNIDNLASRSVVFTQAYVQQALCNPSRTSFLTGRRPGTTGVRDNDSWFTQTGNPNIVTLPSHLFQNGYTTMGLGKIFHKSHTLGAHLQKTWSLAEFPDDNYFFQPSFQGILWAVTKSEAESKPLVEQLMVERAKDLLNKSSNEFFEKGQPFLMAVGFKRPHTPWACPKEFIDRYPLESIKIPENLMAPQGMPPEAWYRHSHVEDRIPDVKPEEWIINFTIPDLMVKTLRRAYYGCTSYVDHQVGQLIDHVTNLGILNDTVIVFMGDHGYTIGERGLWGKGTLFENDLLAPLMISIPGLTEGGMKRHQLVEFVDLFPTLAEALSVPIPPVCPQEEPLLTDFCVEGKSLMPVIKENITWKEAVFSEDPFSPSSAPFDRSHFDPTVKKAIGYSVRKGFYRYTEWHSQSVDDGQPTASFLSDLKKDPLEQVNRLNDDKYTDIVKELSSTLKKGWRAYLPQ